MQEPDSEHFALSKSMFADALIANPPRRYYGGRGIQPNVFDGRDITEEEAGTFLTANNIRARVEELLAEGKRGSLSVTVTESEERIEEMGNPYTARTTTAMGPSLGQFGIPLARLTEYELLGDVNSGKIKLGIYRPSFTAGLTGFQTHGDHTTRPIVVEITRYVGPDGKIDVYHLVGIDGYGINSVDIENIGLQPQMQRGIADVLQIKYS